MAEIKQEQSEETNDKVEETKTDKAETKIERLPTFQCVICELEERYDYFGMDPPYMKHYLLLEDSYTIEDPFVPPKQGEFIIMGANCVRCKKPVCKDQECSIYFDGTVCFKCARNSLASFPQPVQAKINKFSKQS